MSTSPLATPGAFSSSPTGRNFHSEGANYQNDAAGVNKFIAVPLEKFRKIQPWAEFFNPKWLSQPTASQIQTRLVSNLRFFEANYYAVILAVFVFFL